MRVTDRPRRAGAVAAMAVVTGSTAAACATAGAAPAVRTSPAATVPGHAAQPAT